MWSQGDLRVKPSLAACLLWTLDKLHGNSGVVCGTPDLPASKTPQQDPSATRLLGEHGLSRRKTPSPRNGAAYIGLGVTCPYLIGYATSTSLICVGPGNDSAKITLMRMRTLVVYP